MVSKTGKKLNLQKYNVYREDINSSSTFFAVSDFNPKFTSGKNSFSINGTKYLKPNSKVLIEVLDIEGNSLYVEVARTTSLVKYMDNTAIAVAVHVYNNTYRGQGTLTLVGELLTDENGNSVPPNNNLVRWTVPIYIDPSLENTTKVRFYSTPELTVENKFSRIVTYTTSSATPTINSGSVSSVAESPRLNSDYNLFNPFTNTVQYRLDQQTGDPFSASFVGLNVVLSNVQTEYGIIPSFKAKIKEVINKRSLLLETPLTYSTQSKNLITSFTNASYQISHYPTPNLIKENDYLNLGQFRNTASQDLTQSDIFYKSIASITLKNLETFSGNVYRFRVYRKSNNSKADTECIADEILSAKEQLIDVTNPNRFKEHLGIFYDYDHIINYWETSSNSVILSSTHDNLINSMYVSGANDISNSDNNFYIICKDNTNIFYGLYDETSGSYQFELYRHEDPNYYSQYNPYYNIDDNTLYNTTASQTANSVGLQSNLDYYSCNYLKFYKNVNYQITANVIGKRTLTPANNDKVGRLTFYITGSNYTDTSKSLYEVSPDYDGFGIPLLTASLSVGDTDKYFGKIINTFKFNNDVIGALLLSPSYSDFIVSDVSIKAYEEKSYNAGVVNIEIPFPVEINNESFAIKAELFDVNCNQIPVKLENTQFFDVNGKTIIKPIYSINNISVNGVNWVDVSGKPFLISSSLQFGASDSVTFGNITASNLSVSNLAHLTASNAISASYALNSRTSSYSFTANTALTASYMSGFITSASYAVFALTAAYMQGFIESASYSTFSATASYVLSGVSTDLGTVVTASGALTRATASFALTASHLSNTSSFVLTSQTSSMTVLSSSFASTASYVLLAKSASFVASASYSLSASYSQTASYVNTAKTASYVDSINIRGLISSSVSSSWASSSISASYYNTASLINVIQTASMRVLSSSNSLTASYVDFNNISNKPALISSSLQFDNLDDVTFRNITASNITVIGDITAQTLHVQFETSSQIYSSGSNVFGNVFTNTHKFTGSLLAPTITGSLLGTSSVSISSSYALTASYVLNLPVIDNSFTSSYLTTSSFNNQTSSFVQNNQTASMSVLSSSYSITASYASNVPTIDNSFTSSYLTTSSFNNTTASFVNINQTSSMVVLSSSYALTASYASNVPTADNSFTASYLTTSSYNNSTASFVNINQTASMTVLSSSYSLTASYASNVPIIDNSFTSSYLTTSSYNNDTASFIKIDQTSSMFVSASTFSSTASYLLGSIESASYALTASYAMNGGGGPSISSSYSLSSSFSLTSSYVYNQDVSATMSYDGSGKLTTKTDIKGTKWFTYDSSGSLIHITGSGYYKSKVFTYSASLLTNINVL